MTLRPRVRPPTPPRHRPPHGPSPAEPPLPPPPAHPGSALRVSWAQARSYRSNPSQPRAGCVHWRAQAENPCAARACHRLDARGMAPQIGPAPPIPGRPGPPRGPAAPVGTGRLPRWIRIWRAVAAGSWIRLLPVGVLWVSCRPSCVVGPFAARDGETSRDGGPAGSATGNPATPPRRPQCTRPSTHKTATTSPASPERAPQPCRAQPPAQLTSSTGGTWKRWSPGPASNGCAACGTGSG